VTARSFTVLQVVGARPNYVKAAALLRAMGAAPEVECLLVDTGQHYDPELRAALFRDLELRSPDIAFTAGSGTHAEQTARILVDFERVLLDRRPDAVVVVGDVNSTLACALATAKLGIPLVHVEAGLRSYDRSMPEEINRVVTDTLSQLLLTPSRDAADNLAAEGIRGSHVRFVGNVMIDTLLSAITVARRRGVPARLGLSPGGYTLLTLHRPENVGDPRTLGRILEAVGTLERDMPVVFPMHPRTRAQLEGALSTQVGRRKNLLRMPPLGYLDFVALEQDAALVVTDSGGVQEETTALGVPCVTVRERTERPVTVARGTNLVAGSDPARIMSACGKALAARPTTPPEIEGWDGHAAERAVAEIVAFLLGRLPPGACEAVQLHGRSVRRFHRMRARMRVPSRTEPRSLVP
jgi:UDP-N-acetylglucosamine 2-epimerase (non-hydrolysing)